MASKVTAVEIYYDYSVLDTVDGKVYADVYTGMMARNALKHGTVRIDENSNLV